jgi:ABC-type transport system involved in multi-copper enzyme maturation permease subunit
MMLALSLPLLVVVRVFGGVPWDFVVAGTCLTLTAAMFAAEVSMFFSILFRRAFVSILLTLGVGLVLYALVPLIIALAVAALAISTRDKDIVGLLTVALHAHPFGAMQACTTELMQPRAMAFLPGFHWWVNCLVMLAATFGVLTACVALVRRVGQRQACGGGAPSAMPLSMLPQAANLVPAPAMDTVPGSDPTGPARPGSVHSAMDTVPGPDPTGPARPGSVPSAMDTVPGPDPTGPARPGSVDSALEGVALALPPPIPADHVHAARIRGISGSPVLWRELRAVAIRSRVARYIVLGAAGLLLAIIYVLTASIDDGFTDDDVHMLFVGALTIVATIATAVYTAVNVTSEKEAGTWEILLVTPLSEWHVLLAKAAGCVRRCLPIWLLPIGHGVLFVLMGLAAKLTGNPNPYLVHPILPFHLALVAVSVIAFFTGTGLLFGAWLKRTTTAVVLNLGLALLLWAALPGAMYLLAEGFSGGMCRDMRQVAGFTVNANPVCQAGVATLGASGSREANAALADLRYDWPEMRAVGLTKSTLCLAFFTAMYVGLGAASMLLARRILRRRAA